MLSAPRASITTRSTPSATPEQSGSPASRAASRLLKPGIWIGPAILAAVLLVVIVYAILGINDQGIDGAAINAKEVGIALFGPYVLAVELASMLLLAGLVVAFHIGREERVGEVLSNRPNDSDKRKTEEHA